jgi:hypothetical protein
MNKHPVGAINYNADMRITNDSESPYGFCFETVTMLFPPENCLLEDTGKTLLKCSQTNLKLFEAEIKYIFNDSMLGSMTKHGKEIRDNLEAAREAAQEAKQEFTLTKIRFNDEVFYLPLPYKIMVEFFQLARAGYNIDVSLKVSEGKISYTSSPVRSAVKRANKIVLS